MRFRRLNLQHRHIVIGIGADNCSLMFCPVGQRDRDRIGPIDHVKIGDDVSLLVPDKSRPGPLRGLQEIERPGVSLNRRIRDEDHGLVARSNTAIVARSSGDSSLGAGVTGLGYPSNPS